MVTTLYCCLTEISHDRQSYSICHLVTLIWQRVSFCVELPYWPTYVERLTRELQLPFWSLWFDSARNWTRDLPDTDRMVYHETTVAGTTLSLVSLIIWQGLKHNNCSLVLILLSPLLFLFARWTPCNKYDATGWKIKILSFKNLNRDDLLCTVCTTSTTFKYRDRSPVSWHFANCTTGSLWTVHQRRCQMESRRSVRTHFYYNILSSINF